MLLSRIVLAMIVAVPLAVGACKKKDESKTDPAAAKQGVASPAPALPAPAPSKPPLPEVAKPPPGIKVTSNDARGIVTSMLDALSAGQFDEALGYYADNHEQSFVAAPLRILKGKSVLRDLWTRMRSSFPDARVKPRRILDAGERWIVQAVLLGSHRGQFGQSAPTGKPVGTEVIYFLDTKNGKIAKSSSLSNAGAFFRQIGSVPGEHALPQWPARTEVVKGPSDAALVEKVKALYAGLSTGDFSAVEALAAPTMQVLDNLEGGKTQSLADFKKRFQQTRIAFPDLELGVDDATGVGNFVVVSGTAKGTHKGPLGAVPASNHPVTYRFVDVWRFDAGKVAGLDTYADMMQIMQQVATGQGASQGTPPRKGAPPPSAPPR